MLKRLLGDLPSWATVAANPLLAYEVKRYSPKQTSVARIGRVVFSVLVLAVLLFGGYLYATEGFQHPLEAPFTLAIWRIVFFPLLIFQVVLRVAGLAMGVGSVDEERRRQTWDTLRATERGAATALKSRWFSILWIRLRPLLMAIWAGRAILLIAFLVEMVLLQGALQILATRSQPSFGIIFAIVILAAQMTAFFLLPFTATGVDVALGLLLSASVRNRATASVMLVILALFRIGSAIGFFWLFSRFMAASLEVSATQAWLLQAGNAIFGDWGLASAQFTQTGQLWAQIPYSIFIGLVMLLAVLIQAALSDALLRWAAYLAERND